MSASYAVAPRSNALEVRYRDALCKARYVLFCRADLLAIHHSFKASDFHSYGARVGTAAMVNTCVTCNEPLLLVIDSDDDDNNVGSEPSRTNGRSVPDSVELTCGCHFHWSVLFAIFFAPSGG